jgi:two-component system CheB/CheR fusion protein
MGTSREVAGSRPSSSPVAADVARDALSRSEAVFYSVMGSSPDCMKVLDRDGRLLQMNEPGQRLLGICDLSDYLNTCWIDWWQAPTRALAADAVAAALRGSAGRFEAESRTPGGDDKYWDVVVTPIAGPTGEPERLLVVSRDITDRKLDEKRLRLALEQADETNRRKDHFLAVLSHELRTPLTPILNLSHAMARDAALPEAARDAFALIHRNVELETRLVDDLLDITRISSGKLTMESKPVDIHERLRHVAEILSRDARDAGITLTLRTDATAHQVEGDPTRLSQVFLNVLKNAIKFTPVGGRVSVRTWNSGAGEIAISVTDTGMGIDASILPKLFDAFEQGGQDVTRLFGGLGLGLSISKALVDLHGGTIEVRSDGRGKGAEFTVKFATSASVASPTRADDDTRPAASSNSRNECRILLVEDHVDTARVMGRLLTAGGHAVRTAHTCAAALAAAEAESFDVVVSDIGLPDGSGLDLMRQLQELRPIIGIALTGYGMEDDLRQTRDAGFAEHLVKPIDIEELERAIDRVTASRCRQPAPESESAAMSV